MRTAIKPIISPLYKTNKYFIHPFKVVNSPKRQLIISGDNDLDFTFSLLKAYPKVSVICSSMDSVYRNFWTSRRTLHHRYFNRTHDLVFPIRSGCGFYEIKIWCSGTLVWLQIIFILPMEPTCTRATCGGVVLKLKLAVHSCCVIGNSGSTVMPRWNTGPVQNVLECCGQSRPNVSRIWTCSKGFPTTTPNAPGYRMVCSFSSTKWQIPRPELQVRAMCVTS